MIKKKIGSIYSKDKNKQNTPIAVEIPTKRKQSIDNKSTHTQASYKDSLQHLVKSTSFQGGSFEQFSREEQFEDTIKEQYLTFGQNQTSLESCFDSLDVYNNNNHSPQSNSANKMLQKLTCLQNIFSQIKLLRSIQTNKSLLRDISQIQNKLLSMERQFIEQ